MCDTFLGQKPASLLTHTFYVSRGWDELVLVPQWHLAARLELVKSHEIYLVVYLLQIDVCSYLYFALRSKRNAQ